MRVRRFLPPVVAALLVVSPSAASAPADDRAEMERALRSSVRFYSPSASDVAYGPTKLRVSVSPPPDTVVSQVTFYVDGTAILVDRVPPYEAAWNAGERMESHALRAVALFSDGTSNEDAITTRGLDLAEHEVVESRPIEHTELLVTVVDREGEPVVGLTASDFRVKDSGDVVAINTFEKLSEQDKLPLSITVLVDRSGSMRFKMDDWRKACVDLLSVLRPIDQVRVSSFAEDVFVLQDFTRDAVGLASSLGRMGGVGGQTRLFRSLFTTMRDMRDLPGRKAIFLLTDGLDTEFSGTKGMAQEKLAALIGALERLASRAEVAVVTVLPGPPNSFLPIQKLSAETGGWWYLSSDDLGERLMKIGRQLLGGYIVGYDVERRRSPDRKRSVSVSLTGERQTGWEVRTSLGAYGRLGLIDALEEDLDQGTPEQRVRAATELGRVGSERGTEILVEALGDKDAAVREAAVKTLAEQGEPGTLEKILEKIRDDDWDVREAAFAAAVRFGTPAIPYLARIAGKDIPEREGALRALGAIGDPNALPVLREALNDESCEVRAAAADGAGFLLTLTGGGLLPPDAGQAGETDALVSLLEREMAGDCGASADSAALALGRLARPEAFPRLINIASGAEATPRRGESLLVMTSYLSPATFQAIEKRLVSDTPISPQDRHNAAALYAAALRTATWLGSKEGLARITSLGVTEAYQVLGALDEMGEALHAGPEWRARVKALLDQYAEKPVPAPGGTP